MQIEQYRWSDDAGWQPAFTPELGATAQLVLLFGGAETLRSPDLLEQVRQTYPAAQQLGCSTAGEICGVEVTDETLTVTAIRFDQTQVQGYAINLDADETSFAAGDRLGRQIEPHNLAHVFLLSDGLQVNGSDLVRGLMPHLPPGVAVTGGLSGDGDRFQETVVLWNSTPQVGKVVALGLYGDRLKVGYGSFGGWIPFGSERVITKSDGSVLYELDGEPALALYKKYLGEHATGLPASGLLFPLSLQVEGSDRRLVRTILSVSETDQSLTFAGDVPTGTTVRLMQASFGRLVDGAIKAADVSLEPLADTPPDLAILISCVGRKLLLKQRIEEEVEGVREVMGDRTVLTGFYSYGEISPFAAGAPCELHNQTMTITTLREI